MNSKFEELEKERLVVYAGFKKDLLIGILLLIVVIGLIFIIKAIITWSNYKAKMKITLINAILTDKFDEVYYNRTGGISSGEIVASGLLKYPDRYRAEDYIAGSYHGVKFKVSDSTLEERQVRHDSKGNTYVTYVPYFRGRWYIFDYERDFQQRILIKEGGLFTTVYTSGLEKVEVESIAFSKKFKMYTSDKKTVFYIMTPVVIEKLMELEKIHKGQIMFAFVNGVFHMGVNDNIDYLEVNLSKPINEAMQKYIAGQIDIIGAVIDELGFDSSKFKNQD